MQLLKVVALGFFLMVTAGVGLFAQGYPPSSAPAPAPAAPAPAAPSSPSLTADVKLIAFELGFGGGLQLGSSSATVGRFFGVDLTLTDAITAGLVDIVAGNAEYGMVRLSYRLLPAAALDLYVGANANPSTAAGAGISYTVLKSKPDSGLATGLQLRLDYFAAVSGGLGKGDIVLGVVSYIGL